MIQVEIDDAVFINFDHMSSYSWDIQEISPALASGDIFELAVYVKMSNGDDFAIIDLSYMKNFIEATQGDNRVVAAVGTLKYYYLNAVAYWNAVEKNAKENK